MTGAGLKRTGGDFFDVCEPLWGSLTLAKLYTPMRVNRADRACSTKLAHLPHRQGRQHPPWFSAFLFHCFRIKDKKGDNEKLPTCFGRLLRRRPNAPKRWQKKERERKSPARSKLTFSGRTCLGSWRRRCERIYLSLYWVCTRTRSWSHSSITTIDV